MGFYCCRMYLMVVTSSGKPLSLSTGKEGLTGEISFQLQRSIFLLFCVTTNTISLECASLRVTECALPLLCSRTRVWGEAGPRLWPRPSLCLAPAWTICPRGPVCRRPCPWPPRSCHLQTASSEHLPSCAFQSRTQVSPLPGRVLFACFHC